MRSSQVEVAARWARGCPYNIITSQATRQGTPGQGGEAQKKEKEKASCILKVGFALSCPLRQWICSVNVQ